MSKETTTVETVDIDLDQILNINDSIMLPDDKTKDVKPSLFSRKPEDLSFLNEPITPVDPAPADPVDPKADPKAVTTPVVKVDANDPELKDILEPTEPVDPADSKTGRPKLDKQGLVELTNKLIEKKLIVPFEDEKPITEYTLQDFEELFEANAQETETKLQSKVSESFFKSLPKEFQYAARYLQDGGDDLKGLFRSLAAVEEVKTLDPSELTDAKQIVRAYLQAKQFGDTEEIEEEILALEDRDELEAKAAKFKPKLDGLVEQQVQYKLQQQAALKEQQLEQSKLYMDNIYKTLEPAELNGLKLDKKTQNLLFAGLVQPNYQSVSGRQTNLLGHLLEKYQHVEPNHGLIAEALWLLADPTGYKDKVREVVKKEVTANTVRTLKHEEGAKKANTGIGDDEGDNGHRKPVGIKRPTGGNFFKR